MVVFSESVRRRLPCAISCGSPIARSTWDGSNDPDVQAAGKAVDEALGNDGRLLLRQSGTEPLIRVMVEAETPEICEKYVDQVIDALKKRGHIVNG